MTLYMLESSTPDESDPGMLVVGPANLLDTFADSPIPGRSDTRLVEVNDPMSLVPEMEPDMLPHPRFAGNTAIAGYIKNQSE